MESPIIPSPLMLPKSAAETPPPILRLFLMDSGCMPNPFGSKKFYTEGILSNYSEGHALIGTTTEKHRFSEHVRVDNKRIFVWVQLLHTCDFYGDFKFQLTDGAGKNQTHMILHDWLVNNQDIVTDDIQQYFSGNTWYFNLFTPYKTSYLVFELDHLPAWFEKYTLEITSTRGWLAEEDRKRETPPWTEMLGGLEYEKGCINTHDRSFLFQVSNNAEAHVSFVVHDSDQKKMSVRLRWTPFCLDTVDMINTTNVENLNLEINSDRHPTIQQPFYVNGFDCCHDIQITGDIANHLEHVLPAVSFNTWKSEVPSDWKFVSSCGGAGKGEHVIDDEELVLAPMGDFVEGGKSGWWWCPIL